MKTSGLTYTWDAAAPVGDRIVEIRDAEGSLLVEATTYRVAVNSFMAAGGDNFLVLRDGTNRVVGPVDLDALVAYVESLHSRSRCDRGPHPAPELTAEGLRQVAPAAIVTRMQHRRGQLPAFVTRGRSAWSPSER